MTGEREIVSAILERLRALLIACAEDRAALERVPANPAELGTMAVSRRIASRALIKSVEQLEDQLARLFRVLPNIRLVDTSGWYAQDYANFAEKTGILADAFAWTDIIKLRNRLVHDYPLDPAAQLDALAKAYDAVEPLRAAALASLRIFGPQGGGDD